MTAPALLLLAALCAHADVLTLKSGTVVEGLATERGDLIEMKVDGGTMSWRKDVVASLRKAPWKPSPPKPQVAAPAKPSAPPAPVALGNRHVPPDDAQAKADAWFAAQRARLERENASRPRAKVTFEGGNPKCKSYEVYYGPGGKP